MLGRVLSSAMMAVFFLIFATILEPSKYGEMGYLIALAGTFSVVSRFGLPQTVVVYLAKEKKLLAHQVNLLAVITSSAATIILLFINIYAAFLCLGISFFLVNFVRAIIPLCLQRLFFFFWRRCGAFRFSKKIILSAYFVGIK